MKLNSITRRLPNNKIINCVLKGKNPDFKLGKEIILIPEKLYSNIVVFVHFKMYYYTTLIKFFLFLYPIIR